MKVFKIEEHPGHKATDTEVIKRILSGEKELFEILMRRNNQKLYRVIRSYVNDEEEIEDLMQDVYLKAYQKLYQFHHHALFSTWLIRIGINESLARIRKRNKQVMLHDPSDDNTKNIPDTEQMNPEQKLIKQEIKQVLEMAIEKLPLTYKTVYMLREIEGMDIPEIAACLDLTNANVKVRLHRGRAMVRDVLYQLSVPEDLFEFGDRRCDRLVNRVMHLI